MRALYLIPGFACLFIGSIFLLIYQRICEQQDASERSLTGQAWAKLVDTGSRSEYNYENRSKIVYFGVYEFDTADGQNIYAASSFGYCDPKDIPGTKGNMVKVRYNPGNPTEFAVLDEQAVSDTVLPIFKRTGVFLAVLGVLLTVAAIIAMLGFFDPILERLVSQA